MTQNEFRNRLSIKFNDQQWEAVTATEGPVLLIAVPGSGKTTVLVCRIGYMIGCLGIASKNILTITYTRASAADMRRRFASVFSEKMAERLAFMTINSLCYGILRYGQKQGMEYRIASDAKISALLTQIYRKYIDDYPTENDLQAMMTLIAYAKNMMLGEREIRKLEEKVDMPFFRIFSDYNRLLHSEGWIDFDDQMVYAYELLCKDPRILEHYQEKYTYFCVDEAQDTSKIQHRIIALLAKKSGNLFMVGDEDQSIYGFRAAFPEALLYFEEEHKGAKVLYMERNYRSNAKIVEAADAFIRRNVLRHKKTMLPVRPGASDIRRIDLKYRGAQYSYLAKVAEDCVAETAVLYRYSESVLPLVDMLERGGIPYRIRNADFSFFTSRIVKDISDIIRLSVDPKDTEAFLRVYYKMGLYLKKSEAELACQKSRSKGIPILDAALSYSGLSAKTKNSVKETQGLLKQMMKMSGEDCVRCVQRDLGYGEYIARNHMKDRKVYLLQRLGREEDSPLRFLQRLDELDRILREKDMNPDCPFVLSTIHSSKGLEYDNVYLIDVADGFFPESVPKTKDMKSEEWREYEEERRLFYVGVTRAKDSLSVFSFGKQSTFADQLFDKKKTNRTKTESRRTVTEHSRYGMSAVYAKPVVSNQNMIAFIESLGEGLLVRHKKMGRGVISKLSEKQVWIQFEDGEKKFSIKALCETGMLSIE